MSNIQITDLRKEFDVPGGVEVAVDDVSFELNEGEFVTLVGPSGCGKTTTLRCLAGLEIPTSGSIEFDNVDVTEVPAHHRGLAMMFQNIALYPHMTIRENIAYPLKLQGIPEAERHDEAEEAAEIMQIPELVDKYPGELSGGQQQRAALARTIVQDPIAFLMDEPLAALDAKLKVEIRKEIQKVHRRLDKPTLYVTHDQEEALTMSDRIAIMNDGSLEQIGTREEVYDYPKNTFVARFIGNPSINLVDATLESLDENEGTVQVGETTISFETDVLREDPADSDIVFGFRPQGVELNPNAADPDFEGELLLLEPVDDRALATISWEYGEVNGLVPTRQALEEGERVGITIDTRNIYLFDAKTKELIAKSKAPEHEVRPDLAAE
ncbi:ABC transporter ATP-binding protein [Natronococcus roseus]|uniref:ABC transporter ATP-binding protein n=1 Tax=Natronococcus roseus TaxID=1052014 RepID=UPI00374D4483